MDNTNLISILQIKIDIANMPVGLGHRSPGSVPAGTGERCFLVPDSVSDHFPYVEGAQSSRCLCWRNVFRKR